MNLCCVSDDTGNVCVHCGWVKRDTINGWPRRNCSNAPDFRPAAEQLGIPEKDRGPYMHALATWQAEGMPERDEDEQAFCKELCEKCKHYKPDDRCQCGKCAKGGIRLGPCRVMATWQCPSYKW